MKTIVTILAAACSTVTVLFAVLYLAEIGSVSLGYCMMAMMLCFLFWGIRGVCFRHPKQ